MDQADGIVLAAGLSTRMSSWKMTLPFGDSTVIECTVRSALEVCGRVILVTGFRAAETASCFAGWAGVEIAENPDYHMGMFSSVRVGAARVQSRRAFVALGDMPGVKPAVYRALLHATPHDVIVPAFHGKKGHPLLVSTRVLESVLATQGPVTLRDVIAPFSPRLLPVESESVVRDIDCDEDYTLLRGDSERSQ